MARTAKLIYEFGPFRLDTDERILFRNGRQVPLMPKPYETLLVLVEHRGHIVTKEELMRRIWPDVFVQEVNLFKNISDLRKILGGDGAKQYIETIPKRGYRFIAEVRQSWEGGGAPEGSSVILGAHQPEPVFGRETELAQLQSLLETSLRGKRQVVFVTGEPGIGKTALVREFLRRVSASSRLLIGHGQCLEQYGAGEAYLPMLEALDRLCHEPGSERLVDLLNQHAPIWLAQMPSLLSAARREALQREIFGATHERMLREIIAAIEALTADTPLALVIEDLHWSDYSTLDFVSALAQRREPARLLVIGTWRPVEVNLSGHPLKGVNQELQTRRCCVELSLELLTEAAVGEYLTTRFPKHHVPDGFTNLIYRRSEGNPLFMVNLADYLLARGVIADESRQGEIPLNETEIGAPESILPMIERQIDRLSGDEQRVLETASVAGVEFSASVVAAANDADVAQIEELLKGLERRNHFLSAAGGDRRPDGMEAVDYRFIHALYQNVFYERMSRTRRRLLHQQIAERKESAYGARAVEIAAELAMHFEEGGDSRRAVKYLREAAEKALRSYSNREAIGYLRRALILIEQSPAAEQPGLQMKILERLGTVYCSIDEMAEAAKAYEAVVALAQREGQVESEVGALICLCKPLYWTDRRRCLEVVDRIGKLSPQLRDELLKAHARGYCGIWNLHLRGWHDEDFTVMVAAVEEARKADDRGLLGLHLTELSYHQCMRAEYRAANMATKEGMRLTLEVGNAYHYMTGQYFRTLALLHLGEWGELLRAIREGSEVAEKNGHHLSILSLQIQLAWLHEQVFDFERARELCEPIYQQSHTGLYSFFWGALLLGMAHLGLRQCEHASVCFNQIINQLESTRFIMDRIFFLVLHHGLSRYWFEQGEIARAHHEAEQLWSLAAQSGERTYMALGRQTLAEIALVEQDYAKAEAELSHAINAIKDGNTPLAEWRVWQTAARLHMARGRQAEAGRNRARSLEILNRLADSLGQDEPLRQKLLAHLSAQEMIHYIQTELM